MVCKPWLAAVIACLALHALQTVDPHHSPVHPLQRHKQVPSTLVMLYGDELAKFSTLTLFVRLMCLMPFSFTKGTTLS